MTITQLILGVGITALASVIGGISGFGLALVTTPLFLLIGLPLPTVIVFNAMFSAATRFTAAVQLRQSIDRRRLGALIAGSVPGMAVGAILLSTADVVVLKRAAGIAVLCAAVALALSKPTGRRYGNGAACGVGAIAGALGIITSLSGIPPGVMYSREGTKPVSAIADMAGFLVFSGAFTTLVVISTVSVDFSDVGRALLWWLPSGLLATWVGTRLASCVPASTFRAIVIALLALGGLSVLIFA